LFLRCISGEFPFPKDAATQTSIAVVLEYHVSAFDSNRLSLGESFCHFLVGALQDTSAGGPGNTHALGRLLLIQSVFVYQPDRLVLVNCKRLLLKLNHWNTLGLEVDYGRRILDPSVLFGFGHKPVPFLRIFSLKNITSIFSFVKRFVILMKSIAEED
jgi:hypothetical protein